MESEYGQLFETFAKFRKLHISSVLPNIVHSEYMTMLTICCLSRQVGAAEGVSVSKIAAKMAVSSAAVSRSIRQLEEKKYIVRSINRKDRRNIYVTLTGEGEKVLKESEKIMADLLDSVQKSMGTESMQQLNACLEQLYEVTRLEIQKREYKNNGKDVRKI